jgi:hypothetical protein
MRPRPSSWILGVRTVVIRVCSSEDMDLRPAIQSKDPSNGGNRSSHCSYAKAR